MFCEKTILPQNFGHITSKNTSLPHKFWWSFFLTFPFWLFILSEVIGD